MAKDVLITPLDGIIQFSSSVGSGSGQIKVDGDDLVVSNLIGDVLLGDGASDIFIGNGTDNVDIVFEQNGEIRDDGSGKTITIGNKTTTLVLSSSSDITMQEKGGNVGIGTSAATVPLQVEGNISGSGDLIIGDPDGKHISASNGNLEISGGYAWVHADDGGAESFLYLGSNETTGEKLFYISATDDGADKMDFKIGRYTHKWSFIGGGNTNGTHTAVEIYGQDSTSEQDFSYLKVFSPDGTNRAQLHTSGSVFFNPEGPDANVGIGTASPTYKLHVKGGRILVDGDGSNSMISLQNASGNRFSNILNTGGSSDSTIAFQVGDGGSPTEAMIIHEDGKVGIGTSSPTQELDLRGELFISSSTTSINPILIHDSSGSVLLKLATDANQHNDLFLAKSGADKVKLRTYWPSRIDNDYYETGGGLILGSERTAATSFYGLYISSGSNSGSLAVADTDFVVSASKVGIGTKSPKAELHVEGTISASLTGSFGKATIGTPTPANSQTQLTVEGGEGGVNMAVFERTIGGSGRIGINANSSEPQIQFKADNEQERINIGVERSAGMFVIASGSALADRELMVVKQSGEVGIGTTSPTKKLQVEGDISASGDFILGDLAAGPFISGSQGGLKVSGSGITIHNGSADGVLKIQRFGGDIGQLSAANTRLTLRALNNKDLSLEDDAGNVGVFVKDGGKVGIGATTTPTVALQVTGDISSSGTITTNSSSIGTGGITVAGKSKFGTTENAQASHHFRGVTGDTNFFLIFDKDGEEVMKGEGSVGGSDLKYTFGDNAAAGNGTLFQVDEANNKFILHNDANDSKVGINNTAPTKELTVTGEISASSTITSRTGFVGEIQTTGSYDFPGAIVGYTNIGSNSGHASYTITTAYAVPDSEMNVVFVVPKSGKVEIMVQVQVVDNSTSSNTISCALSDAASYNTLGAQHEVQAFSQDETGNDVKTIRWSIEGLTAGTTLQYWFAIKANIGSTGQSLQWGGSGTGRFPDFIMKATALPSNSVFL